MPRLGEEELAEYIKLYNRVVEETISDYEEMDREAELWTLAQTNYHSYASDNIETAKLAEAAIYKEREHDIDWRECITRIQKHAFQDKRIQDYRPLQYAGMAGDEIINHAVEQDIKKELGESDSS